MPILGDLLVLAANLLRFGLQCLGSAGVRCRPWAVPGCCQWGWSGGRLEGVAQEPGLVSRWVSPKATMPSAMMAVGRW